MKIYSYSAWNAIVINKIKFNKNVDQYIPTEVWHEILLLYFLWDLQTLLYSISLRCGYSYVTYTETGSSWWQKRSYFNMTRTCFNYSDALLLKWLESATCSYAILYFIHNSVIYGHQKLSFIYINIDFKQPMPMLIFFFSAFKLKS